MSDAHYDDNLIVRVAARGDGVTADGRFVPHAAPGDRLSGAGGLIEGPNHRAPSCRHFYECGGCQLQHLDDDTYGEFVRERVVGALASQNVACDDVHQPHLSPPHSRRRVALRAARVGKKLALGFSAGGSHRIVDMHECPIMHSELFRLIEPLRGLCDEWLGAKAQWQLKLALVDQGADLLIEGYEPDGLAAIEALTDFARANGLARLSVDGGYGTETRWQPQPATVTLGGVAVAYPPYAFLQATGDGEAALLSAVEMAIGEADIVADLFSGLGTFALPISANRKVYAAEGDIKSLSALKAAANSAQRSVVTEHRDLFRRPLSAAECSRFDAIILDPPRAGAKDQVRELSASTVKTLAYVSCNPATFARDARTLIEAGFQLAELWPVGQFRWSTHVELAARFVRA